MSYPRGRDVSRDGIGADGRPPETFGGTLPREPCSGPIAAAGASPGAWFLEGNAIAKDVSGVSALGKTSCLGNPSQSSPANEVWIEDALSNQQLPCGLECGEDDWENAGP